MSENGDGAKEKDYYEKLRKTVKIWGGGQESRSNRYTDLILASPDLFMLVTRLSRDDRVSQTNRAKLAGAAAYFINPLDLMPEIILGPIGLLDDVALSAFVLHDVLETTDPSVVREHWAGDADILDMIRRTLQVADTMLGGRVLRRILAKVESFAPRL